ncbi:unnamed protein product, partial [Vitis vinifera]
MLTQIGNWVSTNCFIYFHESYETSVKSSSHREVPYPATYISMIHRKLEYNKAHDKDHSVQ